MNKDLWWDQCKYVLDFFEGNKLPFWETENMDELVSEGDYCLANPGELYIVFLRKGSGTLNLEEVEGSFGVKWFDPRNGGELQKGKLKKAKGGSIVELKGAPSEAEKDWVLLLTKI